MHARRSLGFYISSALWTVFLALSLSGCRTAAPPPPDDASLNSAIQRKLTGDTALNGEPIQSYVQTGVAILQGTVSNEAARELAASDASQVPGVRSVVNQLTVQTGTVVNRPSSAASAALAPSRRLPSRRDEPAAPSRRRSLPPAPSQTSRSEPFPPPAPIERRAPQPDQQSSPQLLTRSEPPPPAAPSFRNVTVPSGTTLSVRVTQSLDSATAQQGDAFSGSLASEVVVDGVVALPAGTTVNGRLDQVHEAGHFKGSALLTLSLLSLNRHGERITIATDPYTQEGSGRGKNTAEKVGGGAAVGAILGGIFGGGKGAAIGAAAGGGLGAGANGVTRGQQVQIPSETIIRFRLASPVEVRASTAPTPQGEDNLQHHPGN